MRAKIKEWINKLKPNEEPSFDGITGGEQDILDRSLPVLLSNLRNPLYKITQEEKLTIFTSLKNLSLAYEEFSQQLHFDSNLDLRANAEHTLNLGFKAIYSQLINHLVEKAYLKTRKSSEVYWTEPRVEVDDNDHISVVFSNIPPESHDQSEGLSNSTIYLTGTNPLQFRSALQNGLAARWNYAFEKNIGDEIKFLLEDINTLYIEMIASKSLNDAFFDDVLVFDGYSDAGLAIDYYRMQNRNYKKCANSGHVCGYSQKAINPLIDDVYLTVDRCVLKIAAQHFPALTWSGYFKAFNHEESVLNAIEHEGGLAALHYPPSFFEVDENDTFIHDFTKTIGLKKGAKKIASPNVVNLIEIQHELGKIIRESHKALLLLKQANPRYLFRLITAIFNHNIAKSNINKDDFIKSIHIWASIVIDSSEYKKPFLPAEALLHFKKIRDVINLGEKMPEFKHIGTQLALAAEKFKGLSKAKRNLTDLNGFCRAIILDAYCEPNLYANESSTAIRSQKVIDNLFSNTDGTSPIESDIYVLGLLRNYIEKVRQTIEHQGEQFNLIDVKYERKIDLYATHHTDMHRALTKPNLIFKFSKKINKSEKLYFARVTTDSGLKIKTFQNIRHRSLKKGEEPKEVEIDDDLNLVFTQKIESILREMPLSQAIMTGSADEGLTQKILQGSVTDVLIPISKKKLSTTFGFRLLKSAILNDNIFLIPVIARSMSNPFSITAKGTSILEILMDTRNDDALNIACYTLRDMGADPEFFYRAIDSALRTYRPDTVATLLQYTNGISQDHMETIDAWAGSGTEKLNNAVRVSLIQEGLKKSKSIVSNIHEKKTRRHVDVL